MLVEMFTALVKTTGVAGGLAEKTSGLEGVALWLPPGKDMGVRAIVRAGFAMPRFVMSLPRSDRKRMMSVLGQTAERRKVLMPEPHWYIPAIGVDPEFQGIGLGSSLLEHGMARADRAGSPIYQETEIGRNVDFYLRLRFEVIEEFTPEGLDIRMWLVARR
jgi:ribosomal protein S18 acetylase RimI-like enzyme